MTITTPKVKIVNAPDPKAWLPPKWPHAWKPTYEQRIALLDQILVKLPKVPA